jgi:hypothetical protein
VEALSEDGPTDCLWTCRGLETIEEAYNTKRAQEKSKGSSDGKTKNGHMSSPNDRIPKKAKPSDKPSKKCKQCPWRSDAVFLSEIDGHGGGQPQRNSHTDRYATSK